MNTPTRDKKHLKSERETHCENDDDDDDDDDEGENRNDTGNASKNSLRVAV